MKTKSIQPILMIFVASLVLYSFFHAPRGAQTLRGMVVKCLPIVVLQVLVLRNGLLPGDNYGHKILAGLFLSSIGDAFLDFPGYFLHGAMSFLVAHLFYISAFGFSPLKLGTGAGTFIVLSLPLVLVFENITKLEGISAIVLPLYALVLKVMVWRSVVKAENTLESESINSKHDWGKVATGLGGIFFAISDAALGIDRFYQPFMHSQKIVMATYYLAQLFLALSVFQNRPSIKKN